MCIGVVTARDDIHVGVRKRGTTGSVGICHASTGRGLGRVGDDFDLSGLVTVPAGDIMAVIVSFRSTVGANVDRVGTSGTNDGSVCDVRNGLIHGRTSSARKLTGNVCVRGKGGFIVGWRRKRPSTF